MNGKNKTKNIVFTTWRHDEHYRPPKGEKSKSFVPIPHSLLMHENYKRLKPISKVIYTYMTDYANGQEYTTFPKRVYETLTTKATFESVKKELIEYGFIEEVENGKFTRTENKYRFIDKWKTLKLEPKTKRKTNFAK